MNTLIFTKKIPFEYNDGENIVIMLDWMAMIKEIKNSCFFCLNPNDKQNSIINFENTPVFVETIDTGKWIRSFKNSIFKKLPVHISRFYDPKVLNRLLSLIEERKINRIICHGLPCVMYAGMIHKLNPSIEVIYRVHNVEYKIWDDLSKNNSNLLKKWLFAILSFQISTYEAKVLNFVKHFVVLSNDEKAFYQKNYPNILTTKVAIYIPPFDQSYSDKNINKKNLLITGSMDWKPNIEGLKWFMDKVAPRLISQDPEITITIAGKGIEKIDWSSLKKSNIKLKKSYNNVGEMFNEATILIIPLFSGAGIRIKMLEAMEYGMPTISTSKGLEGIEITNNASHSIDDEMLFGDTVLNTINDPNRLMEMSEKMKQSTRIHYSKLTMESIWSQILK